MADYGVLVCRNGVIYHSDRRHRRRGHDGSAYLVPAWMLRTAYQGEIVNGKYVVPRVGPGHGTRGAVRAFSLASAKRLEFLVANAAATLRTLLTLTYRARVESWECDAARNARVTKRSKLDLNRFLTCMRRELGPYLWVQEFQKRGVIHYHVMCEGAPDSNRVRIAWCRAIGSLDDAAAVEYGAKVDRVESEAAARRYVGRYLGKGRQKMLPRGVEKAGRWWGRSRSLRLDVLTRIVGCRPKQHPSDKRSARILRAIRKFIGKRFGGKFRGGMFVDWGGELSESLARIEGIMRDHFGPELSPEELLKRYGWEPVECSQGGVR